MSTNTLDETNGIGDTPTDEMAEVAADLMPVFWTAAAAVGLENHRRIMNDAADRTKADYQFQNDFMRQVNGMQSGQQSPQTQPDGQDGMGDMIIVGRINNNVPGQDTEELLKMIKGKVLDQSQKMSPAAEPVPTPAPAAFPTAATEATNAVASRLPTWVKAALAASALSTTGMGGALIGTLIAAKQKPPAVQAGDTDTDTTASIGINRD